MCLRSSLGNALFVLALPIELRMITFNTQVYLQATAVKLDLLALKESEFIPYRPLIGLYLVTRKYVHQSGEITAKVCVCVCVEWVHPLLPHGTGRSLTRHFSFVFLLCPTLASDNIQTNI